MFKQKFDYYTYIITYIDLSESDVDDGIELKSEFPGVLDMEEVKSIGDAMIRGDIGLSGCKFLKYTMEKK